MAKQRKVSPWMVVLFAVLSINSGCSIYRHAVPAYCIGQDTPNGSREDREPINFLRLRQDPPDAFQGTGIVSSTASQRSAVSTAHAQGIVGLMSQQ